MQEKERRKERTNKIRIEQIVGELVLYSPLVLISCLIDTLLICLICMICVFIFKHFFLYGLHLNKWYWCVTLSYSLFIVLSLIYVGLGVKVPFLENQPMLLVMACIGIAYLNHYAGKWQKALTSKSIWEMTEDELRKFCRIKGIFGDRQEFVILLIVHNYTFRQISFRLNYAIDTLKDWSPICKKKLGIKDWKPDKN